MIIRVPREKALVVAILEKNGRPDNVVYYPEEGQRLHEAEDQIDEITHMVAWLDKYLKGAH